MIPQMIPTDDSADNSANHTPSDTDVADDKTTTGHIDSVDTDKSGKEE